jgi:hypothetical protein
MDRYNGDQVRDRSRGSREREAGGDLSYGRLNSERDGFGRGRGRSPGEQISLFVAAIVSGCSTTTQS